MSRKYHRYVGPRSSRTPVDSRESQTLVIPTPPILTPGARAHIPDHCCPEMPPWELCEHQPEPLVLLDVELLPEGALEHMRDMFRD